MSKPKFKNKVTRPRWIIWAGVWTLVFGLVFMAAIAATSSYWFCAEICHHVQDDSINSYNRSSHSNVSCLACHMPAGADPVSFMLHKAVALQELPMTIFKTYEIPLNGDSHVSMDAKTMPSTQCTQCHDLSKRKVTPSAGIIIDHDVHAARKISCASCHNRVAHDESGDFVTVNVDPHTGADSWLHQNFMEMDGCYRCHRLADDGIEAETPYKSATGECAACHPADFDLVPDSHKKPEFVKEMHGPMAMAEVEKTSEANAKAAEAAKTAKKIKNPSPEQKALMDVPNMYQVNNCYTCHTKSFCIDCHGGVEMPHPAAFLTDHMEEAVANPDSCATCHGAVDTCSRCHHNDPNIKDYKFDVDQSWLQQHDEAAAEVGPAECFDCHQPTFCSHCHVRGYSSTLY